LEVSVKHGGTVFDIKGEERTLYISSPDDVDAVTSRFLDHPKKGTENYCIRAGRLPS
jgi:hypothetical protein